jgi:hypothetical protein
LRLAGVTIGILIPGIYWRTTSFPGSFLWCGMKKINFDFLSDFVMCFFWSLLVVIICALIAFSGCGSSDDIKMVPTSAKTTCYVNGETSVCIDIDGFSRTEKTVNLKGFVCVK